MKRRADYILEKIKIDTKKCNETDKENNNMNVPCNSSLANNAEDILGTPMHENMIIDNSPEKQCNLSTSSSVIENSPNVSIPDYDPKMLPLFSTKVTEVFISFIYSVQLDYIFKHSLFYCILNFTNFYISGTYYK